MDIKLIISTVLVLFLLAYWIMVFLILYHLTRFGIGVQPKRFAAFFLFGSLALSFIIFFVYTFIDFNNLLQ